MVASSLDDIPNFTNRTSNDPDKSSEASYDTKEVSISFTETDSQHSHNAVTDYPDGGLRAWGVVLGASMIQFCTFGYMCAFGVYQDYYTRVYMTAYSPSAISWIGSASAFLLLSSGLFVGRLYDRGYGMHLLYGGAFMTSLSLFMLSLVKPNQYYAVFLCQGVGMGLGGGLIYVPSFGVVSQYFDKKRTVAMPIVTAGVSLGATLTPILLNKLLQKPNMSFGTVSRIYAGLMTSILILGCCLAKSRLAPPKSHANIADCMRRFSTDCAYVTLTVGFTLFGLAVFFPLFFLQLAAVKNGLGGDFAYQALVVLNSSSFFGRIFCAVITRKIGVDTLSIISMVACGGVVFAFTAIGSKVSILLVGIIYGFFFGVFVATMAPLTALLTDNMEEIGIRLGIAFAFTGLAELVGPPILGALLVGYQWWRPAVFAGALLLASAICLAVVRFISRRRSRSHTSNGTGP